MGIDTEREPNADEDEFTATLSPELRAQEEYLRAQIAARPPMSSRPPPGLYGQDGREPECENLSTP